jgi:hypothetical protein
MSGKQAILGSTAKNVSNINAIVIGALAQRYGWGTGLSTAAPGRYRVKDFMILTDFSRCQGVMIGRVSGRPFCPLLKQ